MGSLFSSWSHYTRARCRYNIVVAAVLLSFIHFSGAIQRWCSRKENSGPNFTSSQVPEVSSLPQGYTAEDDLSRGTTLFQEEITTPPSISLWGGDAGVSDSFYDAANVSAEGDVIDTNATSLWDHSLRAFNTASPSSSPPPANNDDVPTASNPFSGSRGQVEIVWDTSVVSATDYVHSYCPRRCRDGEVVFISDVEQKCPDYLCFPCECARPRCELYGICCPDITEPYNALPGLQNNYSALFSSPAPLTGPETLAASVERSATLPVLMCDDLSSDEVTFLYIGSCQPGFQDDKGIVTLCEAGLDETDFRPQSFTRVADPVNNVVYRNVYCALCNGVEKPVPFLLSVECLDYMSIYTASNQGEMIQLASEPHSGCRVEQLVPAGVSTVRCDPAFFGHVTVDRCDSTIASWTDDRNVSRACAEVSGSVNVVLSPYSGNLYKNLFCGICHVESYPSFGQDCKCEDRNFDVKTRGPLPFTLLLRFVDDNTHSGGPQLPTCQVQEWLSPDDRCLPTNCELGKIPVNKSCRSVFAEISGLLYQSHLWLLPRADNSTGSDNNDTARVLAALDVKIDNFTRRFCSNNSVHLGVAEYPMCCTRPNMMKHVYWVEMSLTAKSGISRDEFEKEFANQFIGNDFHIVTEEKTVTLEPLVMTTTTFTKEVVCLDPPYSDVCKSLVAEYGQTRNRAGAGAVEVSRLLTCAFVTFGKQEFTLEASLNPPMVTIILDLNGAKINFSKVCEMNMLEITWDGRLNVCMDLLDTKLRGFVRTDKGPMNDILEFVTFLSLGVSMCCLLITFLTYICIAALRNVAGVHNMFLSGSLMCAQALILVSYKLMKPSTECTVIGVVTHFFWLFKFSSTLVCCLHMYRVFSAQTPASSFYSATGRRRSLLVRCAAFTLSVPTLTVLGVIVFHLVATRMKSIGYGDSRCYLDSPKAVGITLAGPALLISACNLIFFALTVRAIRKVTRMVDSAQIHKDHHDNLYVYAKLSTMTGAFWTLSILAENLDVDILRFIAIVINGLQGVFVFISYTCNKRVLKLCMPRLSRSAFKTQSPLTTNTA
ncbi:hypothetical protein Btru_025251 [Bulinus truncatus]|nr:hypothetical protein Btru_025251 [Bulinus truncatus]